MYLYREYFRAQVYTISYLSGIMGNQRLTFFIILGLHKDYTAPKRLKVTHSTTRIWVHGPLYPNRTLIVTLKPL